VLGTATRSCWTFCVVNPAVRPRPAYVTSVSRTQPRLGATLLMFGLRRRGVAPVHAGMTVDQVRQRFSGARREGVNAERTSDEAMAQWRVGRVVDRFELWCYQRPRTSS